MIATPSNAGIESNANTALAALTCIKPNTVQWVSIKM
jgi:hypothetical protein